MVDVVLNWLTTTGIRVVVALVVLIISFNVINVICKKLEKKLEKKEQLDRTLTRTLTYAGKLALKGLVLVCLVGYLGIETSGISAVIASLGVCAGLAVNGTLSNLAGGVMLLITRPFSVGDYIEAQGTQGSVEDIRICYTKIITLDNKVIYLPNSALSTGTIINYSEKKMRRVDLDFSVAGNDPKLVKDTLLAIAAENAMVLKDPEPFARITDFGAGNGTKVTLRVWCATADYWNVYADILESAEKAFADKKIVVPFNQLDVHIDQK